MRMSTKTALSYYFVTRPTLLDIVLMKYQSSNLNTFPRCLSLISLVNESRVGNSPRPPINLRIETLEQQHLIRLLLIQIIPFVSRACSHRKVLSLSIRINEFDGNEIVIRNAPCICDCQRISPNRTYRSPNVDDLISAIQKPGGFSWLIKLHVCSAGIVRLVDVHSSTRATR
jgi:hypothetical protein